MSQPPPQRRCRCRCRLQHAPRPRRCHADLLGRWAAVESRCRCTVAAAAAAGAGGAGVAATAAAPARAGCRGQDCGLRELRRARCGALRGLGRRCGCGCCTRRGRRRAPGRPCRLARRPACGWCGCRLRWCGGHTLAAALDGSAAGAERAAEHLRVQTPGGRVKNVACPRPSTAQSAVGLRRVL